MDRPIVFSARFYTTPSSTRRSYFHLYRVSPNGKNIQQLTHAPADDDTPRWSPTGKHIAFTRQLRSKQTQLMVVDSLGKNERVLWKSKERDPIFHWESETQLRVSVGETHIRFDVLTLKRSAASAPHERLDSPDNTLKIFGNDDRSWLERSDKKTFEIDPQVEPQLWLDNTTILGVTRLPDTTEALQKPHAIALVGRDGKLRKLVALKLSAAAKAQVGDEPGLYRMLSTVPYSKTHVLLSAGVGNSTDGHWFSSLEIDLETGAATPFGEHLRIAFAPDATQFVTCFRTDLAPYGPQKTVEARALYLGNRTTLSKRTPIVQGRVFVSSADWLGGSEVVVP